MTHGTRTTPTTRPRMLAASTTVLLALGGLGAAVPTSASAHDLARTTTLSDRVDERPTYLTRGSRLARLAVRPRTGTPVRPAPTPTPTPTPTPVPVPAPAPTTVYGVPSGVALTATGALTVSRSGAVVEGLDVNGCVVVTAPNVTIRNSRIRGTCDLVVYNRSYGLVLDHVEIDGRGTTTAIGIGWGDFTARGVYIHGVGDGVRANGDVLVEKSLITGLASGGGSHNDGIQITEGSNIRILNNVIENRYTQTAAIMIGADQGNVSNVLVEGNVLSGGGYTLYGGARPPAGNTISGIVLRNNAFSKKYFERSGAYGPLTATDDSRISVSGNVWLGTTTRVGP